MADDGLQHYGLARDVELVVFDARGVGNGHLLPAGPLREPLARLAAVDAVVLNGDVPLPRLPPGVTRPSNASGRGDLRILQRSALRCAPATDGAGKSCMRLPALAIRRVSFVTSRRWGLRCIPTLSGSSSFRRSRGFRGGGGAVVLMTEKDAVKCAGLITGEAWVLPVGAELSPA